MHNWLRITANGSARAAFHAAPKAMKDFGSPACDWGAFVPYAEHEFKASTFTVRVCCAHDQHDHGESP